MKKKKYIVILISILAIVFACYLAWDVVSSEMPIASNCAEFKTRIKRKFGAPAPASNAIYEMYEYKDKAVFFTLYCDYSLVGNALPLGKMIDYSNRIWGNSANLNIKTSDGVTLSVFSEDETLRDYLDPILDLRSEGYKRISKIDLSWLRIYENIHQPELCDLPDFTVCGRIRKHSDFNDILRLGYPVHIAFIMPDSSVGDPTVYLQYMVEDEDGTPYSVGFYLNAEDNELTSIEYAKHEDRSLTEGIAYAGPKM